MKYRIRTEQQRQEALRDLQAVQLPAQVEIHEIGSRTLTQNAALHVWLGWLADALNEAGHDMRATLKPDVDIPWTAESAKAHLWRPIQEAMTGQASTADAGRLDYAEVEAVLSRHLASRLGVQAPPWPKKSKAA